MKLHYSRILLFCLPLNIWVSSSYAHSENKQYITTHTPTTTSRVLSECDLYIHNDDDDADMKSVKENFDRQTSQRFEEYDERMKDKRRKCKEQCDKDIQEIIEKDKINKSLAQKVEKGCLRCGCGLGGVAAGVGIFGAIAVNEWTKAATATATQKGIEAGINVVIKTLKTLLHIDGVSDLKWKTLITAKNYADESLVGGVIKELGGTLCGGSDETGGGFCLFTHETRTLTQAINGHVPSAILKGTAEVETVTEAEMVKVTTTGGAYFTGIIVSVVVIVVIVLVMIIIYLVLRNRRKTKMTKKMQYMKLLKE
ncbi:PIR protein, putative [Plasmodium sp. gorilla clade G1]|nr:PIR protein, putative [Plasmodium sp. gorilla clade G1]